MQNQKMPKQIAAVPMKGIRKRVRPRRRWSDKIEGDLTVIRIKK
jgi:hypothetical protein